MAPKTYYLASGGKDGLAMVWNLVEGKFLGKIECESPINIVLFAPKKYWLVMGTDKGIRVWDLQGKKVVIDLVASPINPIKRGDEKDNKEAKPIACTSLAWNKNGTILFAGFADSYIRVYKIVRTN